VVVVKAGITEAATKAAFVGYKVASAATGVGSFAATAIQVVFDGKATSFPDKSVHRLLTLDHMARSARLSTLVRYAIGSGFWMARRRGRNRFISR
jgi:hypothetical protein